MRKTALIYKFFILIFCFYNISYSREILELSTIKASEGAILLCDDSNVAVKLASSSSLKEVVMQKSGEYMLIEVIEKKYSKPFYYEPDIPWLLVVEKQVKLLYENHQFLSGPNVSSEEVELANDTYLLLKEALGEVHKSSKCLEWEL